MEHRSKRVESLIDVLSSDVERLLRDMGSFEMEEEDDAEPRRRVTSEFEERSSGSPKSVRKRTTKADFRAFAPEKRATVNVPVATEKNHNPWTPPHQPWSPDQDEEEAFQQFANLPNPILELCRDAYMLCAHKQVDLKKGKKGGRGVVANEDDFTLHVKVLRRLLNTSFLRARDLDKLKQVELIETASGATPIFYASGSGCTSLVSLLLSNGASLSSRDLSLRTPLFWAAFFGHQRAVDLLLKKSAEPNVADAKGITALHVACARGHAPLVSLLTKKLPSCDIRCNKMRTPLHLASKKGNLEAARMLITCKADLRTVDKEGSTPLHFAAQGCHLPVCRELLDRSSDLKFIEDFNGQLPLALASANDFRDPALLDILAPPLPTSNYSKRIQISGAKGMLRGPLMNRYQIEAIRVNLPPLDKPDILKVSPHGVSIQARIRRYFDAPRSILNDLAGKRKANIKRKSASLIRRGGKEESPRSEESVESDAFGALPPKAEPRTSLLKPSLGPLEKGAGPSLSGCEGFKVEILDVKTMCTKVLFLMKDGPRPQQSGFEGIQLTSHAAALRVPRVRPGIVAEEGREMKNRLLQKGRHYRFRVACIFPGMGIKLGIVGKLSEYSEIVKA